MSTRSRINLKLQNDTVIQFKDGHEEEILKGKYISIYCHFDGYTSYVGDKLKKFYNTYDKVLQLICNGDISSIEKDGSVRSYYEDYHEDDLNYYVSDTPQTEAYMYVFDDNDKWYVAKNGDDLKELTQELIDSDY